MTRRIFRTIFLVAMVVLLACLGLIMGVLYDYFNQLQQVQLRNQLEMVAHGVEEAGKDYVAELDVTSCRITWVAQDGAILYDTKSDESRMENHLEREEIQEALESGYGESTRYSHTMMSQSLYTAKRMSDGSVLRLSMDESTVVVLVMGMIQPVCVIFLAVVVLAMFLAARLSRRVVKPLNEVNLDDPLSAGGYAEITPLLRRLDSQQKQLRSQEKELKRRQDEFQTVIGNMSEGLVLLNRRGTVLSINPAAMQLLGVADCVGKDILATERTAEVRELVLRAVDGHREERLVGLPSGQYQVDANPVESNGVVTGVVLLLFDVTEKQKSEVMRREFTANVSHELKTPLHSISGYAELLYRGMVQSEDVGYFSEKIYTESQRMIKLVEDIIRLSRLDEGAEQMLWEQVDLLDLAQNIVKNFSDVAHKAGVTMEIKGEHASVPGITQLLSTAVSNLVDNGVKYNRPGGSITVDVGQNDKSAWITVRDTGIGIPQEHQDRIFERFYRVDKSHSKAVGGTGLGLSIVKHTAAIHNAEIELESVLEEGTAVTIRFTKS